MIHCVFGLIWMNGESMAAAMPKSQVWTQNKMHLKHNIFIWINATEDKWKPSKTNKNSVSEKLNTYYGTASRRDKSSCQNTVSSSTSCNVRHSASTHQWKHPNIISVVHWECWNKNKDIYSLTVHLDQQTANESDILQIQQIWFKHLKY